MEDTEYFEDGVARIVRLMRDTFGDQFKAYFNGENLTPPQSELPCIMVTATSTRIESDATTVDQVLETVVIIMVLNKKDDIGATEDTELTDKKIRRLVMGQDVTTGQYLPQTVMYALRKHFTMQSDTIQNTAEIDFTPNVRGDKTAIPTQEAWVTVQIRRIVSVGARD